MSEYVAAECLREEVARFKRTNRFTPMEVTGFYIQAAVVLDEHEAMVQALGEIELLLDCGNIDESHWQDCLGIARATLARVKRGRKET